MVSELLTAPPSRVGTVQLFFASESLQSPVRAACDEAADFSLEQTTLVRNSPTSAHAGSIVRAQNARAIPSNDAHTSVVANGHGVRFCCDEAGRMAAVVADVWFELDTYQDSGWRMKRSRPAAAV